MEIAKSFRQNLCHTALEPLTTSNEPRFIPLSRLRRAGKAAYPLLPFSFQIQSLCFEFVRTSSEVSELSSRLTEARRYAACEDDIMLCGLRLVWRKFCSEIHLLILLRNSIKTAPGCRQRVDSPARASARQRGKRYRFADSGKKSGAYLKISH